MSLSILMPFSCRAARMSTDSVTVTVSFMAVLFWFVAHRGIEPRRPGVADY